MIDTVVLMIPKESFSILRPEFFKPDCTELLKPDAFIGAPFTKAILNPSKKDIEENNYKPRLTLINRLKGRNREISLKVEFSAPKLLFGNNFDELTDTDLPRLGHALGRKLNEMGVIVSPLGIGSFPVTTAHFSKNIALTDHTSASMIINQLYKVDLPQRLDLDRTSFRNGGHCLHYHANSFEIAIYDKIKDLQQSKISEKRAIEDSNSYQSDLFEILQSKKPFEVIRIEVRLNTKKKIQNTINYSGTPTLSTVFSEKTSQEVLLRFWDKINKGINLFAMDSHDPIQLLEQIRKHKPDMKPQKVLKLTGAVLAIQKAGARRLRSTLGLVTEKRHIWSRLKHELRAIEEIITPEHYKSTQNITNALESFAPLKLKDFDID